MSALYVCRCFPSLTAPRSRPSGKMVSSRSFVLAIVLVFSSQVLSARLRRDADTTTQGLVEGLRTQIETATANVNKALGLPEGGATTEELTTVVQNTANQVVEKTKGFVADLSRQLESMRGELSENTAAKMQEAQQTLNTTIEQLTNQLKDAPNALESIQQRIASTMETMAEENSKIARAAGDDVGEAHDRILDISRTSLNQAMDVMRNFATEIQAHANRASES